MQKMKFKGIGKVASIVLFGGLLLAGCDEMQKFKNAQQEKKNMAQKFKLEEHKKELETDIKNPIYQEASKKIAYFTEQVAKVPKEKLTDLRKEIYTYFRELEKKDKKLYISSFKLDEKYLYQEIINRTGKIKVLDD